MFEFLNNAEEFALTILVAGVICFFIEKIRPAEKNTKFFKKDFQKELWLGALNSLILLPLFTLAISLTVLVGLKAVVPQQAFNETLSTWPLALQIFLSLFMMDFSTYWRHRLSHRYLWPFHAFHHSAEEITWLTSIRLHPIDYFFAILFDTLILYLLGFSPTAIATATVIIQVYNFFTHLNLNFKFSKPLCYILASPHYHRWHHANEKAAYDKNFCAMFSLLDVIFGTYYNPNDLPTSYGLSPNEQRDVPSGLIAHLILPIKKIIKK